MVRSRQGLHKPRSLQEDKRLKEFGGFIQEKRWNLNMSQAHLAKMTDLSQSQIARVEQGSHQPRRYILDQLDKALSLQGWERVEFYKLAGYFVDPIEWGIPKQQNPENSYEELLKRSTDNYIEFQTEYIERIHQIRVEGNSRRALEMTWSASERLNQSMREASTSKQYEKLLSLLARALYEQGLAYSELSLPGELYTAKTSFIKQLKYVTNKPANEDFFGLSEMFLGDAYYVVGKHSDAVKHLKRALNTIKNFEARLFLLATLGKSFAYLHQERRFGEIETQIRQIIDADRCSNAELIGTALESIARSHIQLGLPKAHELLNDAKRYSVSSGKMPLIQLQILACELGLFKNQHVGNSYLSSLAENGLLLANQFGVPRQVDRFKRFLENDFEKPHQLASQG